MKNTVEQRLTRWACAEIQHQRGRGAIVMAEQAVLEPVSVSASMTHEYSPVCKVTVPVILESREEAICTHHFSNADVARICGKVRVA